MVALAFAVLFSLTFISWSFEAGHARWDLLWPGTLLAAVVAFAMSRKRVQMDDEFLYVSVFRRVASIPLQEISRVSESIGMRDRSVTIHFRAETPFGRSISFTPSIMFCREPHPIVSELLAHAQQHHPTGSA